MVDLLLNPVRDHALPFTASRPQPISGAAYHPRIFVVDDNPGELDVLTEALAVIDGAAEIETSTSGHLAMARLSGLGRRHEGRLPDLVVLDIRMPLISGPDLLSGIRAQSDIENLRVVMVTGAADQRERDRCTQLGAIAVLTKPINFAGYLALARRLMGMARAAAPGTAPAGGGDGGAPGPAT